MASRTGCRNPGDHDNSDSCPWAKTETPGSEEDQFNHLQYHLLCTRQREGAPNTFDWVCVIGHGHDCRTYTIPLGLSDVGCLLTCHPTFRATPADNSLQPCLTQVGETAPNSNPLSLWKEVNRVIKLCGVAPSILAPEPRAPHGSPAHHLLIGLVQRLDGIKKVKKLRPDSYKSEDVLAAICNTLAAALDKVTVYHGAITNCARGVAHSQSEGEPEFSPQAPKTPPLETQLPPPYQGSHDPPNIYPGLTTLSSTIPTAPDLIVPEALPVTVTRLKMDGQGNTSQVTETRPRTKAEMKEFITDTARRPDEPPIIWVGRLALEQGSDWVDREEALTLTRTGSWSRGLMGGGLAANNHWSVTAAAAAHLQIQGGFHAVQMPPDCVNNSTTLMYAITGSSILLWDPTAHPLNLTNVQTVAQNPFRFVDDPTAHPLNLTNVQTVAQNPFRFVDDPTQIPIEDAAVTLAVDNSPNLDTGALLWLRGYTGQPIGRLYDAVERVKWATLKAALLATPSTLVKGSKMVPKPKYPERSFIERKIFGFLLGKGLTKEAIRKMNSDQQKDLAVKLGWEDRPIPPQPKNGERPSA
nr:uncharacterized protein LOC102459804 [Pelodiscus sinensis]|eukprot:XP_014430905.1 uncharacterized protein LOC102459804 [Pelodiscus sinensis]